jgi:myosin heavy subunit
VDLLECRRSGVFALIDEVVRTPGRENKHKDSMLTGAFDARFRSSECISTIAKSAVFSIKHYAGKVSYCVAGFCER